MYNKNGDNMNNRGFTLAELLGVIIIMTILSLVIIPNIISSFVDVSNKLDDSAKLVITEAAKDFYYNNQNSILKTDYCITVEDLQDEGLLSKDIKDSNGKLIPVDTIIKIASGGTNYQIGAKCSITDSEIINAAKSYYNDGNIIIANGSSKCITVQELQDSLYLSKNIYQGDNLYDSTTIIKITNGNSLVVSIESSC